MLFVGFFFVVVCGNFVFLFRMYSSIWYYCFDLCIPLLHAVAAALFMFCVCVQVVVSFASPKHECLLLPLRVCCRCICVNLPKPFCYCESVYWFFFLLSLSLTKLSMENKCGSYILQNINKNSQVVPKIFFFCIF